MMTDNLLYHEKLSSNRTEALFIALTLIFFLLFIRRRDVSGTDALAVGCLIFSVFFLFYVFNYRALDICLTPETLTLTFGIFKWVVPLDNVENCRLDKVPPTMRYGGAGIHFMMVRNRYRVSFNFLEYPRVVIAFKRKAGLVRDVSFSTRRPEEVVRLIQKTLVANSAPEFGNSANSHTAGDLT